MDYEASEMYWQAMTVIESQDMLLKFKVSDYPHLKQEDRKKTFKQTSKLAYPRGLRQEGEPLNTRQLMERIQGMINGR